MYAIVKDSKTVVATYYNLTAARGRAAQLNHVGRHAQPPEYFEVHTYSVAGTVGEPVTAETFTTEVWIVMLKDSDGYGNYSQRAVQGIYGSADKAVAELKRLAELRKLTIMKDGLSTSCFPNTEQDLFYAVERWEVA